MRSVWFSFFSVIYVGNEELYKDYFFKIFSIDCIMIMMKLSTESDNLVSLSYKILSILKTNKEATNV